MTPAELAALARSQTMPGETYADAYARHARTARAHTKPLARLARALAEWISR